MNAKQVKNYILILILIGVLYLGVTSFFNLDKLKINTCFLKAITGIPCPACGTTRAFLLLFKGEIYKSIVMNPLGIVVFICVFCFLLLFFFDLIFQKKTINNCFDKFNAIANKKFLFILFFTLLIINWIWNVNKMN
jgi:hypothetical protein